METNIFEEIQHKRFIMKVFAKSALDKNWIDQSSYDDIVKRLENDTLTIGVIGQMKCGKSTFLNAFLFGDDVLPAATTPMTAALSVITYGEKKSIEAEFYSPKEWDEMVLQASRNLDDPNVANNEGLKSRIQAAKELLEKSSRLHSPLSSFLGQKKIDGFDNLIEYVGADGKYVAITKSVIIHYPKEWLKGVEIVDTPGFNDPIVSREERTQEFLKKADVVIMLLYAGRAFDATDRSILFDKVQNVGVGKILIGVNKYDLCYRSGETIEEIQNNVIEEIKKACKEEGGDLMKELLIDVKPILLSAEMALFSRIPFDKIKNNSDYKFHWDSDCDDFEISTQKEMLDKSLICNFECAVRNMVDKSKQEILFKKPLNMILQAGINAQKKAELDFNEKKRLIEILSTPDDELGEKILNLEKAQRKIENKSTKAISELDDSFDECTSKFIRNFEKIAEKAESDMYNIIENNKRSNINNLLAARWKKFSEREIPHEEENAKRDLRNLLNETANQFEEHLEDVVHKCIPDSEDELISDFQNIITKGGKNVDFTQVGESDNTDNNPSDENEVLEFIGDLIKPIIAFPFIIPNAIIDWLVFRKECRNRVAKTFLKISFDGFKETASPIKEKYIHLLGVEAIKEIIDKLMEQLQDAKNDQINKAKNLEKAKVELKAIEERKKSIENQVNQMNRIKLQIMSK